MEHLRKLWLLLLLLVSRSPWFKPVLVESVAHQLHLARQPFHWTPFSRINKTMTPQPPFPGCRKMCGSSRGFTTRQPLSFPRALCPCFDEYINPLCSCCLEADSSEGIL